jgi:hypothetical protein
MAANDPLTFGIYWHAGRKQYGVRYRTHVDPCPQYPRGTALVHIGFASTMELAQSMRNAYFRELFGPDGVQIAWDHRAQHKAPKRQRDTLKAVMQGQAEAERLRSMPRGDTTETDAENTASELDLILGKDD